MVAHRCVLHEVDVAHGLAVFAHILVLLAQGGELFLDVFVVAVDPLGELLHIVGAGDEAERLAVEPVGSIGLMARGEDGSAVFERDAYHLRLPRGGRLELVADGGHEEVARRALSVLRVAAYCLFGGVLTAVDIFAVFHEVVAGNAVDAGYGASEGRRVADGGDGGDVVDLAVLAGEALAEHPSESSLGVFVVEAIEVVPAHLVYSDAYDKFRTRLCCHRQAAHHQQNGCNQKSFHMIVFDVYS